MFFVKTDRLTKAHVMSIVVSLVAAYLGFALVTVNDGDRERGTGVGSDRNRRTDSNTSKNGGV